MLVEITDTNSGYGSGAVKVAHWEVANAVLLALRAYRHVARDAPVAEYAILEMLRIPTTEDLKWIWAFDPVFGDLLHKVREQLPEFLAKVRKLEAEPTHSE